MNDDSLTPVLFPADGAAGRSAKSGRIFALGPTGEQVVTAIANLAAERIAEDEGDDDDDDDDAARLSAIVDKLRRMPAHTKDLLANPRCGVSAYGPQKDVLVRNLMGKPITPLEGKLLGETQDYTLTIAKPDED